jgi:hypothetical protein
VFEARRKSTRPTLVDCGDDKSGKAVAAELIRDVGFDPVDAGPPRDRPIYRAIRAARRPTGVRGKRWPGPGVPIRAVWEIGPTL